MAKRKNVKQRVVAAQPRARIIPGWMSIELDEAEKLSKQRKFAEARQLLVSIDRRSPGHPAVLSYLADACLDLHDMEGYQEALERLIKVDPGNEDVTAGLIGACLQNARPALALQAARSYLAHWPDGQRAAKTRETLAFLEGNLPQMLADLGAEGERGFELAVRHEQITSYVNRGRLDLALHATDRLLHDFPLFVPALNNLTLAYEYLGQFDQATATAQRVLETQPDNVHALANLVRIAVLTGHTEAAQAYAERLLASDARASDRWVKKAEGLTYAGNDHAVLEIAERVQGPDEDAVPRTWPMLLHLAGVAALNVGREQDARRYWKQALRANSGFTLASDNLADLKRAPDERQGPWPFSLANWLPSTWLDDLTSQVADTTKSFTEDQLGRVIRRFCRAHPGVEHIVPHMLLRGNPETRELALMIAQYGQSPALTAALKDFALSRRGPDRLRFEAAAAAMDAGLISPGPIRMWMKGEWQDIVPMKFAITDEPMQRGHSAKVLKLAQEAAIALTREDTDRAEEALRAALAVEPDAADLLHNLAICRQLQGRQSEYEELIQKIFAQEPDYLFARTGLMRLHVKRGEIAEARELAEPLLLRRKFHFSEFSAFCTAILDIELADGQTASAQAWLNMWEEIDKDNPAIAYYRTKTGRAATGTLLRGLFKR